MTEVPLWFLLALLCALFWSIADAFSKRSLREHSAWAVLWVRWGYAIPFLALAVLLRPLPAVDPRSWLVLAVSAPLEITAGLCYLRALQISPLSLTVPLLAWTPVFTALLSFVVLGEVPQKAGFLGIFLVGAGSYVLTWEGRGSPLGPIRALRRERGSLLMLTVALIYSLTSALGKLGVLYSSPVFFGFAYALFVTALYTVVFLLRTGAGAAVTVRPNRWFVALGAAAGLMMLFHFTAIEMTQVAYMISVKRSSLLFTVLIGSIFFREGETGRRFLGAAVMFAGMLILSSQG